MNARKRCVVRNWRLNVLMPSVLVVAILLVEQQPDLLHAPGCGFVFVRRKRRNEFKRCTGAYVYY